MACKHAQSILLGKKHVKRNNLKQFLGDERDEHNVIMVQLFCTPKERKHTIEFKSHSVQNIGGQI
jgi:hypothetical protein